MSKDLAISVIIMLLGNIQPSWAGDGSHDEKHHNNVDTLYEKSTEYMHTENMKGLLLKKEVVDGYHLTFHVMKAEKDEVQGCEFRFMFRVEQNGAMVQNVIVNSRVRHPNNQSESKMMVKTGDWYTAAYDLTHPGEHELIVLFKVKDDSKHSAKVTYMVEKKE
ncbi:hypothetical protein MMIC_P1591 [Mariprofundus micogutta]|uniref:YtkA-like domain-containing protein n=1 Tax=Mariprofundus micogutta TaxID=1921010 RepID=A0A1L8CP59_9PROT|nr:hypothetical protein [Mariprofundus micogutta]GAV20619.1 hypothetical protein MMIC_P1591 [Mariprofundus micogutta]